MARVPIGLELYSVRNQLAEDARGTLKAVAAMGYDGVEFAGLPNHSPQEYRGMLDEYGLVCCGTHTPFAMVQDDKLDETIAVNKTLGNRFVIVPGIPADLRKTRGDWRKLATFFDALADKLAAHDMLTGYHNHHIEFAPLDGEQPWDTFFGNTKQDVIMQLDTGNALSGGGDCVAILKRYPGRAVTVHLKPYSVEKAKEDRKLGFRPMIGEDDIPWPDVFRLCETTGNTEWYIVEYESDAYPPLESVERCLRALKGMGK
ncbi:MAG: sugar phosphate isomerase/epimerase [Kiritimatiellae bacterium]|nr:sugar phosphate isomerase/epimerase [Kiritimatiellia bacterium]